MLYFPVATSYFSRRATFAPALAVTYRDLPSAENPSGDGKPSSALNVTSLRHFELGASRTSISYEPSACWVNEARTCNDASATQPATEPGFCVSKVDFPVAGSSRYTSKTLLSRLFIWMRIACGWARLMSRLSARTAYE